MISNDDEGVIAEINYIQRGWMSNYYTNRIEAEIKDSKSGEVIYKIEGYYTSEIYATDMRTG